MNAQVSADTQLGKLLVPDIGDFREVEVIDILIKPGDSIAVDAPLLTLETDKATMDVPSSDAGVVQEVLIKKGDKISRGSLIATIASATITSANQPAAPVSSPPPPAAAPAAISSPPSTETPSKLASVTQLTATKKPEPSASAARVLAGPAVRRMAREFGVDLTRVTGTAPRGRIKQEDVQAWIKQAIARPNANTSAPKAAVTEVDFSKFGPVEIKPLGRIQKISGPRLLASWSEIPHVWQMEEADITELEVLREKLKAQALQRGIKLTPMAFILRACAKVLQQFPAFNTSLNATSQQLVHKQYLHLGFAADTPNGLVVPVIRNADRKDIFELAQELAELSEKARAGRLQVADMQGGCFTVSSLGSSGGTGFTPIINAPEVAILGVARTAHKPVYQNGTFVPRSMLPFTLAYDHRVIDGAAGARFTTALAQALADPRSLIEAVP